MRKAIVLDWDGVVFDDDAYKAAIFSAMADTVDGEQIRQLYETSKDKNGYNDRRLAAAIAAASDTPLDDVQRRIDAVMTMTSKSFIFTDARQFITSDRDVPIILLTAGDERIQHSKVSASMLEDHIDRVIVISAEHTERNKEQALANLLQEFDTILFFDDRLSTILHLHEMYRETTSLVPIFVDRLRADDDAYVAPTLSWSWMERHEKSHAKDKTLIAVGRMTDQEQVLLVQESDGAARGLWTLPGGHVENDQTFLEAAEKEFEEEAGIRVHARSIHRLVSIDGGSYGGSTFDEARHIIIVCFIVNAETHEPAIVGEMNCQWASSEDLPSISWRSSAVASLATS